MTRTASEPAVRVLGSVSVEVDGRPVPVGGPLPRRLLAVLLASRGAVLGVDRLVEVLWGDEPPEAATSSLHSYVSRLRRLLPPSVRLETAAPGYRLRLDPGAADVERFEVALDEALACLADRPEAALAGLEGALSLWQGDAFAEFGAEWWAQREAGRLEDLRLHAREVHAEALLGLGRGEAAVSEARAVTAEHPSRERAWRTLVLGLHRCGRQRDALRAAGEYRARLRDESGLDPSKDFVALEARIAADGRGYRFVADVREGVTSAVAAGEPGPPDIDPLPEPVAPSTDRRANEQRVQFCKTPDGVRLAYASVGDGPPLVKAANWLSHLDYDWESPLWGHWWRELSVRHRLVRYDERGCGLSDWDVDDFSLETWVTDLETVVDAAGIERFPLLGVSQGGPVAITYAARHPERVRALILYGTYGQGRLARARTPMAQDEARLNLQLARLGWGRDDPAFRKVFAMQFMPNGTAEQWDRFEELQRRTTSPANAVRFLEAFQSLDVIDVASRLTVPTMVLHARNDVRAPLEEGRRMAALITGSRFVTLESSNHLLLEDEPAWPRFLAAVESFLDDHS